MRRKRLLISIFLGGKPWGERRRPSAAWFCAAPGATVALWKRTMCEGDCNRTIRHFAGVLFILKPTTWRSEAAQYESASERRRRCRAPFLRRGDSTFLTSGVNWSLGIKKTKNKPEPPVLSDAIAHLCQSSRGSSSNLDLDCRSWFSTPRSLPHDFHRAARSFSFSFVWSVEGLSLTDAVQTSKPFAALG